MAGRVTQTTVYEESTGEVIYASETKGSPNGKGWVIMYTDKVQKLIVDCPSAATLKVFMLLSMGQKFEERGVVTTKKAVQEKLGITKPTCLEAFKWLKENFIINEIKVNGCSEFMVNPAYVTIGRDKKKRLKEWNRRWSGQVIDTVDIKEVEIKGTKYLKIGRSIDME